MVPTSGLSTAFTSGYRVVNRGTLPLNYCRQTNMQLLGTRVKMNKTSKSDSCRIACLIIDVGL